MEEKGVRTKKKEGLRLDMLVPSTATPAARAFTLKGDQMWNFLVHV